MSDERDHDDLYKDTNYADLNEYNRHIRAFYRRKTAVANLDRALALTHWFGSDARLAAIESEYTQACNKAYNQCFFLRLLVQRIKTLRVKKAQRLKRRRELYKARQEEQAAKKRRLK